MASSWSNVESSAFDEWFARFGKRSGRTICHLPAACRACYLPVLSRKSVDEGARGSSATGLANLLCSNADTVPLADHAAKQVDSIPAADLPYGVIGVTSGQQPTDDVVAIRRGLEAVQVGRPRLACAHCWRE